MQQTTLLLGRRRPVTGDFVDVEVLGDLAVAVQAQQHLGQVGTSPRPIDRGHLAQQASHHRVELGRCHRQPFPDSRQGGDVVGVVRVQTCDQCQHELTENGDVNKAVVVAERLLPRMQRPHVHRVLEQGWHRRQVRVDVRGVDLGHT